MPKSSVRHHDPGIALATVTGTANTFTAIQRNTAQPAFQAQLQTSDANATGDGTSYRLGSGNALIEIFDQGSNNNTNGTFTAPVTGKYVIGASIRIQQIATNMTEIDIRLVTSNRTYNYTAIGGAADGGGDYHLAESVLADMDADDTFTVTALISNGSKVADILGATTTTRMWAYLPC
jgi:hypothetical protein